MIIFALDLFFENKPMKSRKSKKMADFLFKTYGSVPYPVFSKIPPPPQITAPGAVIWHDFLIYVPLMGGYLDIKQDIGTRATLRQ